MRTRDRVSDAAALLARAFHDDPMMAWVVPDTAERPRLLGRFFAASLRYAALFGRLDIAPGRDGAAAWLPPGDFRMTPLRMLRSGHLLLPFRVGSACWRRLARLNRYALMLHSRTVPEPHWYLYSVGVEPSRQRRGVGAGLLKFALERADADHLPCYLETSSESNLPLYERLGFKVAIRGRVPPDGPPIWAMVRPARR